MGGISVGGRDMISINSGRFGGGGGGEACGGCCCGGIGFWE